jgi:hypothetical protein
VCGYPETRAVWERPKQVLQIRSMKKEIETPSRLAHTPPSTPSF